MATRNAPWKPLARDAGSITQNATGDTRAESEIA